MDAVERLAVPSDFPTFAVTSILFPFTTMPILPNVAVVLAGAVLVTGQVVLAGEYGFFILDPRAEMKYV
jgi:hypothetical protein